MITVLTADDMLHLGATLAQSPVSQCVIYLQGPLGAGKTTFVRGLLQGLGHKDAVKSPTYTLVESYYLPGRTVFHWDLYRLKDPEELENIGIRDYIAQPAWWLIEWPMHMKLSLPSADLLINFSIKGESREVTITPLTETGNLLMSSSI